MSPAKHLTNLAGLKHSPNLFALILATLLLAACGGSSGGGSSGGGSNEKAPLVEVQVVGSAISGAGGGTVYVAVTATKQDNSNTTAVTFPPTVESSGCTAILAGSGTSRQYNGTTIGSLVNVTYSTTSSVAVECGAFAFSASEDGAVGRDTLAAGVIRFVLDSDGDGVADAVDVDADGDGLIELSTAAELNMMRYNLGGTGLDDGTSDNDNTTGGNSMGCGGNRSGDATACNGYEQMADIDLNDWPSNPNTAIPGSNWEPIGTCGSDAACDVSMNAQLFTGTFSGNNFNIRDLLINVTTERYGVGFFGAISPAAQVRNVHIRGGNITADAGVTSAYISGLVGYGNNAIISNSSVTLGAISGTDQVGGLLGWGSGATISSSVATVGSVSGASSIGGLVGTGVGTRISSSVAIVGSVSGASSIGGLVGNGENARIYSSVATVGSVSGISSEVGGLVGRGDGATISSSVAKVGSVSGTSMIGGLVGIGVAATISSSVAKVDSISGASSIGGLVGNGENARIYSSVATVGSVSGTSFVVGGLIGNGGGGATTISSSIATVGSISGTDQVGGLLGQGFSATINSSVAVTNNITGTSNVGGLAGGSAPSSVTASYWDDRVSFFNTASNAEGSSQTTAALQAPTIFTGTNNIYTTWGDAWCNPTTGEFITDSDSALAIDANRVWDLGTSSQYPAITCARNLLPLDVQREAARRALAGELPLVD